MADTFPFAKYFGEINLLSSLQVPDTDKTFFDRPPRDPEQKELLLYLGCNVLRMAHFAQLIPAAEAPESALTAVPLRLANQRAMIAEATT